MTRIDIISGFLGAGKTTLIKKLLEEAIRGEQVVLIENEFGEIGIDGGFLKEAGIQISEMNSGCICCSLVGDFGEALRKVREQFHPDRILIEPSGVGKLSDVTRAVLDVAASEPDMALGSAVTVADATKCKMYMKNFGEFYNNQVEHAGTIILSRTRRLAEEKLAAAVALLRERNPRATVITTPWDDLDGGQILSAMEGRDGLAAALLEEVGGHDRHDHGPDCACGCHDHHDHQAGEVFASWGGETARAYGEAELRSAMDALDGGEYGAVLRAKGIVPGGDGRWLHFDYVPGDWEVRPGAAEVTGRLCVIGSGLREDGLRALFRL